MQRRQLLSRVVATGLVLVGMPRLLEQHRKAVDLRIVLTARDQASAAIREAETAIVRLANRDPRFDPHNTPMLTSGYLQLMEPAPDYKWLAGVRWEVIPDAPMATWWQ